METINIVFLFNNNIYKVDISFIFKIINKSFELKNYIYIININIKSYIYILQIRLLFNIYNIIMLKATNIP